MTGDTITFARKSSNVTDLDRSIAPRRETDRALLDILDERLQFEQLVSQLSALFVNLHAEDVDDVIQMALSRVSIFMAAELSTFILRDPETGILRHSHQWVAKGTQVAIDFTDFNIKEETPWLAQELTRQVPIEITRMQDFPPEAANERAICESIGIKSVLWVPISVEGALIGCIALNTIERETVWSEPIIQRLKLLGEVFANALVRKRAQEVLEQRLRFEHLLTELSTHFVKLSACDVDAGIDNALALVGEFVGADETFVLQMHPTPALSGITHGWFANGADRELNFDAKDFLNLFPWADSMLQHDERIIIESLNSLPKEAHREREYLMNEGIEAALVYPLSVDGDLLGALFVHSFKSKHWSTDEIERLQLTADLFTNTLSRKAADEQLRKACTDIENLKERLQAENTMLREEIEVEHQHKEIIGNSDAIKDVLAQVEQVADTDATVLILGETGTGKELLAREVHNLSSRKDRPMVTVNCAALPATLIEAELFGREKGAYTGALTKQVGRFEIADGSTLFLDEVSELPLELQAKLLRILQYGEFERLGSNRTITVDVRIIAATNCDLSEEVKAGRFREDLYYRLNVFPISVPPLRERREDIPALVWAFVKELSERMGKNIDQISNKGMDALQRHAWPGNVRELHNMIERAMILSKGSVLQINIPTTEEGNGSLAMSLEDVERKHIFNVLEQTGWHIRGTGGAAEILDLKPTTLHSKMKKLGINRG
jgi:transcriptional regulator with GAF, ATPase, and Fis domain